MELELKYFNMPKLTSPFATRHIADIQKLMACLLWTGKFDESYNSPLSQISWMRNLKGSSAIFWDSHTTLHWVWLWQQGSCFCQLSLNLWISCQESRNGSHEPFNIGNWDEFQLHLFSFVLSRRNKQLRIPIQCWCSVAMSSVISLS
jgi:hypothetical protein